MIRSKDASVNPDGPGEEAAFRILGALGTLIQRAARAWQFLSPKSAAGYADLSDDSLRQPLKRRDLTAQRLVKGTRTLLRGSEVKSRYK